MKQSKRLKTELKALRRKERELHREARLLNKIRQTNARIDLVFESQQKSE